MLELQPAPFKTKKMEEIEIKILKKNDYFGEVSLIHDGYRTASVTSLNYCTLGKLDLKNLYSITDNFPHFRRALMIQMHTYDDNLRIFLM